MKEPNKMLDKVILFMVGGLILLLILTISPVGKSISGILENNAFQSTYSAQQDRRQQQAEWNLAQSQREQVSPTIVATLKNIIPIGATIILVVVGIMFLSGGFATSKTILNVGDAISTKAEIWSRTLDMNPRTGHYPVLISRDEKMITDINTHAVLDTTKGKEPMLTLVDSNDRIRQLTVTGYNNPNRAKELPEVINPKRLDDSQRYRN